MTKFKQLRSKYEVLIDLCNYLEFDVETLDIAVRCFDGEDLVKYLKECPIGEAQSETIEYADGEKMLIISLDYPDLEEHDDRVIVANFMGVTVWKNKTTYQRQTEKPLFRSFVDAFAYEEV